MPTSLLRDDAEVMVERAHVRGQGGTIGGFGDLFLKGNLGGGDHTLNVADGNGDFSGRIAGKAFVHHLGSGVNLIDFDLTR